MSPFVLIDTSSALVLYCIVYLTLNACEYKYTEIIYLICEVCVCTLRADRSKHIRQLKNDAQSCFVFIVTNVRQGIGLVSV